MKQRVWRTAALLSGGLILCVSVFLAGCGDPEYQEKSPEDIKVIKADQP